MSDRKAVIKNADMSEEMQQDAVDCATQALEKYNIEKVHLTLFCFKFLFVHIYLIEMMPTINIGIPSRRTSTFGFPAVFMHKSITMHCF